MIYTRVKQENSDFLHKTTYQLVLHNHVQLLIKSLNQVAILHGVSWHVFLPYIKISGQ
jgi:hypothetical protein